MKGGKAKHFTASSCLVTDAAGGDYFARQNAPRPGRQSEAPIPEGSQPSQYPSHASHNLRLS